MTDTDETVPKQVNITIVLDLDYRKKNPEIGLKTFQSESNAQPLDYGGVKQKYTLSDAKTTIMYQLKRTNEYLFIGVLVPQLAIPDPGLKDSECLTISKVFVSYKRCKATKKNMATYPSGVAPSDDEPYTKIKGVCNSNAEPVNKEKGVELYCDKNGTPFQIYGCQCKAGYTLGDSSSCTGDIYVRTPNLIEFTYTYIYYTKPLERNSTPPKNKKLQYLENISSETIYLNKVGP